MPEPPITEAEEAMMAAIEEAIGMGQGAWDMVNRGELARAIMDAAQARLLASGTPLWVQDDGGDVHVYTGPDPEHMRHECAIDRVRISPDRPLTPPGTVHQAVLLMKPEGQ